MDTQQLALELGALVGADAVYPGDERFSRSLIPASWTHLPLFAIQPGSPQQIVDIVKAAEAAKVAIVPCGSGSKLMTGYLPDAGRPYLLVNTGRLDRILDYQPDDMTVTCEPGVTLEALQQTLAAKRQFLALDAPLPSRATLGGLAATNTSGFTRALYGTPRDLIIGVKAVMTGGVEVKGGGKVVKNVAGYDVCKLFTGAWGTLGMLTEVIFRVRPMPEAELAVAWRTPDVATAARIGLKLHHAQLAPAYLLAVNEPEGGSALVAGLHGTSARVHWQRDEIARRVQEAGLEEVPVELGEMETEYLRDVHARLHPDTHLAARIACLPADLPGLVERLELLECLRITAQSSVGVVSIAASRPDPSLTLSIQSALPKTSSIQWVKLEPELADRRQIELWGGKRADFALQSALHQALDPLSTFSPGRFIGRL